MSKVICYGCGKNLGSGDTARFVQIDKVRELFCARGRDLLYKYCQKLPKQKSIGTPGSTHFVKFEETTCMFDEKQFEKVKTFISEL